MPLRASQHWRAPRVPSDEPPDAPTGTVTGVVLNAATDRPLEGVRVSIGGSPPPEERGGLFLPLLMRGGARSVLAAPGTPQATGVISNTTTGPDGTFTLALPAGVFTVTFNIANFTNDERLVAVTPYETSRVQDVRLHALDPNTEVIGSAGGTAVNSLGNSSVQFEPGSLATPEEVRVTYLPNDELPGPFPDGSIPMGFSAFEPEGVVFPQGKEVLWTVEYDGPLPVGTDTLCYWWDGKEGRWRDPVPGKVVDLGGGQKGLQARVPHFSAYGHAVPGIAGQRPGQGGNPSTGNPNAGQGPDQTPCDGCEINVGTGSVAESYDFPAVSGKGFPVALTARYSTANDTPEVTARVPFTITTQTPARATWRLVFQGKVYSGEGYTARATWDTRNAQGQRVAPGLYPFTASETFYYDSGARPSLTVSGTVEVRRGDVWPFGFNWITTYDTLLVDKGRTVTIIGGDGQYLTFGRRSNRTYEPLPDGSTLARNADGTWLRRWKDSTRETFNAQGRLVRIEDSNGNAHTLAYEPTGAAVPPGGWALTERLVSITDASGRRTTLSYGSDGYVSRVADPTGRQYRLAHDAGGNLTSITDPLGRVTRYEYDDHLLTKIIYPNGHATTIAYDAQRRLVRHAEGPGQVMTASYGNNRSTFTDERGVATTYQTNDYGAIVRASNPVQSVNYSYDGERRLTAIDQFGQRFTYDARGNLTKHSTNAGTVSTTYDPTFNLPTSITDGAGNTTRYTYDARGNLTNTRDPLGQTTRFEYDAAGQLTRIVDPLDASTRFAFDEHGNVTRITDPLGFVTRQNYDDAGNRTQIVDPEEHVTRYAYDRADRLTSATDALGGVTRYQYDTVDNLTRVTDPRGNSTAYTYDDLDRLTRETDALGNSIAYTYDPAGNLTSRRDASGATLAYSYDPAGRLVGERSPDGEASYSYNALDDVTAYEDPTVRIAASYPSGMAGLPDTVETRLLDNPNVRTTLTYDYLATESAGAAATGSAQAVARLPAPGVSVPPAEPAPKPLDSRDSPRAGQEEPDDPVTASPGDGQPPRYAEPQAPGSTPGGGTRAGRATAAQQMAAAGAYLQTPTAVATDVCGTINTDTTWTAADSPYVVTCDVVVAQGATLTVEPGVVVKFKSFYEDLWVAGTLVADGGPGSGRIFFTSINDHTVGGNTGTGNPAPNDWSSIHVEPGSTGSVLDNTVVRYGAGDWNANVRVRTSDVTLTNNTIASSGEVGLLLENTLPATLTGNQFLNNIGLAVWAALDANDDSIALSGNMGSGNLINGFVLAGSIGGDVSWDGDDGFPFVIWDDLAVNTGATLTLAPDTIVKFNDFYDDLWVHGTLLADTTAAAPITFTSVKDDSLGGDSNGDGTASSPAPNDWSSIHIEATSTGSVLDNTVVRYGAGDWNANVRVRTSDVTLTNNTIAFSAEVGLLLENTLPATLTGNQFLNNASLAVWAPLDVNDDSIALSGNSASGNLINGFVLAGSIGGNVTWDGDDGFPFVVWDDLTINAGATLTLAPDTIVKFNDFFDDLWVHGTLLADTTADAPITFTSVKDDSLGGDSNGDGSGSSPAPNDWSSIHIEPGSAGSVLDNSVVRYGGGDWNANVRVRTSDVTLTNNTITFSAEAGLLLENTLPATLTGNQFLNNVGVAVWAPLDVNDDSIALSGNTASGNLINGFVLAGSIGGDVTWDGDDQFAFIVWDDLAVNGGATLRLTAGTTVKFRDFYDDLWVNGTLIADGSAGTITFTSLNDNSVGGSTGSGNPAPNEWSSIRFTNTSTGNVLDNVAVRYAGGDWNENVYVNTAGIALRDSTISFSAERGITVDGVSPSLSGNTIADNVIGLYAANGARPRLRGNRFSGNAEYGVFNATPTSRIDAERNGWGSGSGPYDPSDDRGTGGFYNPNGSGDPVSDGVDYDPWLTTTGLLYGLTIATGSNPALTIGYGYDALARLSSLEAAGSTAFTYRYTYDAAGNLTAIGPASGSAGARTAIEYDANGRVTRLVQRSANGAVSFGDYRTTYDKVENVLTESGPSGTTTYTYDALSQLTRASAPGLDERYSYDAAGNRLSKNAVTYTYDDANQLLSSSDGVTYSYDANGNLHTKRAGGQTTTYTWNAYGRLVRIDFPDGTFAAYTYDFLGNRLSKRDRAGTTTYYVYDALNLVQEVNAGGEVIASYVYDDLDHPLSMTRGGVTYYYLADRMGNVTGLTDGAGALVASYRYDPWGNVIATGGSDPGLENPFRFTGRQWDPESGLYYYRARYYDPQVGRFISRDPLPFELTGNSYAYALNNPVALRDPLGLFETNMWVQRAIQLAKEMRQLEAAGQSVAATKRAFYTAYSLALNAVSREQRIAVLEYINSQSQISKVVRTGQRVVQAGGAARATVDAAARAANVTRATVASPGARVVGRSFGRRVLGCVARLGGGALRVGGRLLPGVGLALLAYDAYSIYRWWRSPC